jgi:hypothetical protein
MGLARLEQFETEDAGSFEDVIVPRALAITRKGDIEYIGNPRFDRGEDHGSRRIADRFC